MAKNASNKLPQVQGQQPLSFKQAAPTLAQTECEQDQGAVSVRDFEDHLLNPMGGDQAQPPSTALPKDNASKQLVAQCKAAMDAKDLGSRSALGLRFSRELNNKKGMKKDYDRCGTQAEKLKFRIDWAKEKYDTLKETQTFSEELTEQELDEGTYEPLDMIFVKEGSTKDAWTRAMNYAEKATKLGGLFWRKNVMTEGNGQTGLEFLYFKKKSMHIFNRCWAKHQVREKETTLDEAAAEPDAALVDNATATPVKKSKVEVGKRKAAAEVEVGIKPNKKIRNEVLEKAIVVAKKVKTDYKAAVSQYTSINESIKSVPEWAKNWTFENVHRAAMDRAKNELDGVAAPYRDWLIYDFGQLKGTHEPKQFLEVITKFPDIIRGHVDTLGKQCNKLQRMQKESYV